MSDWAQASTPDGRVYYWNKATKVTSWEKPEGFDAAPAAPATPATPAAANPEDWVETKTEDARVYYYNKVTRQTSWQKPAGFEERKPRPDFVAGGGGSGGGGSGYGRPGYEDRIVRRDDRGHGLPQKPTAFEGSRGDRGGMPWETRHENTGFRGAMPVKTDEPEYATAEQAEEAFFKLLKRNHITPDTEWPDALKAVVRDREYRAIKDPKDRRLAFEKYRREMRELEKTKEKERRQRIREEFRRMLSTHDEIKHYTRWKTARSLIEREAVFKSAGDEDERRRMFDEYIVELRKRHMEDESKRRKTARTELDKMLKALITDRGTQLADAEDKIAGNERFVTEDVFRSLHRLDLFYAFETHIMSLERVDNAALQQEKHLRRRRKRQARDAFKRLLAEKVREGKIKATTDWSDVHPLIASDPRYVAYVDVSVTSTGFSGSEPIELFWDVTENEERRLRNMRNDALDVLDEFRWEVKLETSFQDFVEIMSRHPKTAGIAEDEVQDVFNRILEKVKRREEQAKRDAERQKKELVDYIRQAMKRLEPPVRMDDKYEEVAQRLTGHRDFEAAEDEVRRIAFDKYINRLKQREDDDRDRARRDRERERDRDSRNGARREERDRERRHRTRTPEIDAYEADRRKAQEARERSYRKPSFGLSPPPRDRRDDRYDRDRRHDRHEPMSIYDRERRERELERERNYISRADPRDKGRTLDYGDEDTVGSRPGSVRKRRDSEVSNGSRRDNKRTRRERRTASREPESILKEEPPALQSGSEEGEIEEI